MSVIVFSPAVGPIRLSCILSEDHSSSVEITGNPIETGAEVNDHAYIKPKQVVLEIADENAALTYNALVTFQESRVPFYLVTGLKLYDNMLIQAIDAYRDKDTNSILKATVYIREVIIVSTAVATSSTNNGTPGASSGGNSSASGGKKAKPGGKNSRKAVTPSKQSSANPVTADRAAGTVKRGDTPAKTTSPAKSKSLAKSIFG